MSQDNMMSPSDKAFHVFRHRLENEDDIDEKYKNAVLSELDSSDPKSLENLKSLFEEGEGNDEDRSAESS